MMKKAKSDNPNIIVQTDSVSTNDAHSETFFNYSGAKFGKGRSVIGGGLCSVGIRRKKKKTIIFVGGAKITNKLGAF
jgi:hypothetical protein